MTVPFQTFYCKFHLFFSRLPVIPFLQVSRRGGFDTDPDLEHLHEDTGKPRAQGGWGQQGQEEPGGSGGLLNP